MIRQNAGSTSTSLKRACPVARGRALAASSRERAYRLLLCNSFLYSLKSRTDWSLNARWSGGPLLH
jgi:hypothetical protein